MLTRPHPHRGSPPGQVPGGAREDHGHAGYEHNILCYTMLVPVLVLVLVLVLVQVLVLVLVLILYYTILYYTILYYTILYYTILYYTILYYTIIAMQAMIDLPSSVPETAVLCDASGESPVV